MLTRIIKTRPVRVEKLLQVVQSTRSFSLKTSPKVCPKGLDCSKFEFNYIGKINETECCEQYVKNLVGFYNTESSLDSELKDDELVHVPDTECKK